MRAWFIVGAAIFVAVVTWRVVRGDDGEEMFIRLGGRDLRSLPL